MFSSKEHGVDGESMRKERNHSKSLERFSQERTCRDVLGAERGFKTSSDRTERQPRPHRKK